MGFARGGVWVIGYCGLMGYGVEIPAHQVGGREKLWDIRVYGLSKVWVMRVSTVLLKFLAHFLLNLGNLLLHYITILRVFYTYGIRFAICHNLVMLADM